MGIFQEPIAEYIWDYKYRYRLNGDIIDKTIEDTWLRVATAAASAEKSEQQIFWQQQFYDILKEFQFLPGGRILAGAGTEHTVTLFNCFVMPIMEDSIHGIFDALKEGALTLQQGGGIGYDFSLLRPKGFPVLHAGATASGPVSFMHIWNTMCATLLATGARRGAMMAVLRCDHPDIEEFINAKNVAQALTHFNISVLMTDAFIQAVENNADWELVFPIQNADSAKGPIAHRHWSGSRDIVPCQIVKVVKARELWDKITKSAYDYAEPGVLFEDTINSQNNLWYREWISATNPCGEIPLPSYGACNLGAINLTKYVLHPFSEKATIDWKNLEKTVIIATRFLDNVIDVSRYPLGSQQSEALGTRRIGLGITGLGSTLVMLNLTYASPAALSLVENIMKFISELTWKTSIELAKEREPFPFYLKEKYLAGQFVKKLNSEIIREMELYGVRNSHHNTIAPTGTISLLANNISNGIEPIFSAKYERTVRTLDAKEKKFTVTDYAIHEWRKTHKEESLPPAWSDSQMLTPEEHLRMQSIIQPYVDNAISKTINLPVDFPMSKLNNVYQQAYTLGLKGCTIYRPSTVRGSVLSVSDNDDDVDRCCQIS